MLQFDGDLFLLVGNYFAHLEIMCGAKFAVPAFSGPRVFFFSAYVISDSMVADGLRSPECNQRFRWEYLRKNGVVFDYVEVAFQNRWYVSEDWMPIADED